MNKGLFLMALVGGLMLSGCAELAKMAGQSTAAPIEERTDAAAATGQDGAAKAAAAAATGRDGAGLAAQTPPAPQVETHALPGISAQGKALDGVNPMLATTAKAAADPRLKDPAHTLSKRVIYFDFDSSAIREEYRELIETHAAFIKANKGLQVILQGHTDERGSRDYNLALGQRRAESVRQAMALLGVPDEQMEAVSLGEEKPVQEGHDEAAWQQNRRTEIHYQGE